MSGQGGPMAVYDFSEGVIYLDRRWGACLRRSASAAQLGSASMHAPWQHLTLWVSAA